MSSLISPSWILPPFRPLYHLQHPLRSSLWPNSYVAQPLEVNQTNSILGRLNLSRLLYPILQSSYPFLIHSWDQIFVKGLFSEEIYSMPDFKF